MGRHLGPRQFDILKDVKYSPDNFLVEYLVVGGGGGGGIDGNDGGGGGAGGLRSSVAGDVSGGGSPAESPYVVNPDLILSVTVGAGGPAGQNGSNSVFGNIISLGGGHGGGGTTVSPASDGGSGGGGGDARPVGGQLTSGQGTEGQGFRGGIYNIDGGGGGGAGGPGSDGPVSTGGIGVESTIKGFSEYYAGGGAGGRDGVTVPGAIGGGGGVTDNIPEPGTSGTGGGGAGRPVSGAGAPGGSGVVILRYPPEYSISFVTGSFTTSSVLISGKIFTRFSSVGSGTIRFIKNG